VLWLSKCLESERIYSVFTYTIVFLNMKVTISVQKTLYAQ
jgi:hypothetical protein